MQKSKLRVLVTCPPMLKMIDHFEPLFGRYGAKITAPEVIQTLSAEDLGCLLPQHDGWIIGDDPASRAVFEAGKAGNLRAAVKWGIGVDNVDFQACQELGISITNTPNMFGKEVADLAMGYVIALARRTFEIDRAVRTGEWLKPQGISLEGKTAALIGYGDIGKNTARRLIASEMNVLAYDPLAESDQAMPQVQRVAWPERIGEADFIIINCALTPTSHHLFNASVLEKCKTGVRIINVARGPIIDEPALEAALETGKVFSAALDVFENEPLPSSSILRNHPKCILGSHNASNTKEAVIRTSEIAISSLMKFLGVQAK